MTDPQGFSSLVLTGSEGVLNIWRKRMTPLVNNWETKVFVEQPQLHRVFQICTIQWHAGPAPAPIQNNTCSLLPLFLPLLLLLYIISPALSFQCPCSCYYLEDHLLPPAPAPASAPAPICRIRCPLLPVPLPLLLSRGPPAPSFPCSWPAAPSVSCSTLPVRKWSHLPLRHRGLPGGGRRWLN